MAELELRPVSAESGWAFEVTVAEGESRTTHQVTVGQGIYERLTGGACSPEELVRKSFEFLLAREPKESILRQFDIKVIASYFPEYEREIGNRIQD
jgi:hypothetical protein